MAVNKSVGTPQVLGGHYEIVRELAAGGFGHTFVARDLHLPGQPLCVVKQLKLAMSAPGAVAIAQRLFDQEAKTLYALGEHPQIPRLLAHFEETQPGRPTEFYLAQELIDGKPLSDRILIDQPWPEVQAIALLQDLLQILAFVHQQGVIHRDIKPANLLWREADGRIVLIDFGAVKSVQQSAIESVDATELQMPKTSGLTVAVGTPGYMPSEQQSGKPRFSSDVYAVGKVLIQAVTGLAPWQLDHDDDTGEIEWRSHAPHISDAFAKLLDKMVRYDFRSRYLDSSAALTALRSLPEQTLASVVPVAYLSTVVPTSPATDLPSTRLDVKPVPLAPVGVSSEKVPLFSGLAQPQQKVIVAMAMATVLAIGTGITWWAAKGPFVPSVASDTPGSVSDANGSSGSESTVVASSTGEPKGLLEGDDTSGLAWSYIEMPLMVVSPGSMMGNPPPISDNPPQEAYDLAERADTSFDAGRYPEGVALYQQATRLGLDTTERQWEQCDLVTREQGRSDAALDLCARVAGAEEINFVDVILAVAILTGQGEYERSLKVIYHLEATDPNHPTLKLHRANALIGLERYEEALTNVNIGLERAPDMAELWVMQGEILMVLNRPEEALSAATEALTIAPQNEKALALTVQAQGAL